MGENENNEFYFKLQLKTEPYHLGQIKFLKVVKKSQK
jgi:hypothetical protein